MEAQKWNRRKMKAKSEGNLEQLAYACNKLAEQHFKYGHYEDALKEYKEEATVYEALGDVIKLAVANRMIGEVYSNMGLYNKALKHQMKHLELARSEANEVEEQRAFATIGRTYFCQAESIINDKEAYQTAITNAKNAYKKSLNICERLSGIGKREHMEMRARLLLNIGLVLECQQDMQKAVDSINNAVQICKEHDLFEDLFRCYSSLGMLYHRQQESSKALTLLGLAIDVAARLEDKVQLSCEVLLNKAEILFSLPDFQGAKQALRHAYKLKTPIEADQRAIARNLKIAIAMCGAEERLLCVPDSDLTARKKLYETMGDGCVAVKNYPKALEYYHKMLECAERLGESGKQLVAVYVSLSQTYKDNEQYDLALEFYHKELELWVDNPTEACKTTLNIGEVLELQGSSYAEMEEIYNRARSLAQEASSQKLEVAALRALFTIQEQKGRNELAIETQKELELLERNIEDDGSDPESEEGTPDIADDICLETYTDSDIENEEFDRSRQPSRRTQRQKVHKNEKGETQLHVACISGRFSLVKKLVEQGHPVNVRDHCGWLPIHEASNHGHRDIVEYLLDKGAAINDRGGSQCGGVTPLHDAASCGHLDVIELLLDRGATIVCRTDEGDTPLDCLLKWYARTETRFSLVEQSFFDEIQTRLRTALQKAGHYSETEPSVSNTIYSPQPSGKKRSRSSGSPQRTVDIENRDSESRTSIWQAISPPRDLYLSESSNDSLPTYQQDIDGDDDDGWIGYRQPSQDATEEYRNVMTMLRKKEKSHKEPIARMEVKEPKAFLADEDVGDDWLENDMGCAIRPSKKRCTASAVEKHRQKLMSGSSTRRSAEEIEEGDEMLLVEELTPHKEGHRLDLSPNTSGRRYSHMNLQEDHDEVMIEEVVSPDFEHRTELNVETISRTRRSQGLLENPRQSSLSDMGLISRQSVAGNRQSRSYVDLASTLPNAPVKELPASLSVRVRVKDKLLLVPVEMPEKQKIGWLARETARRYYNIEGLQPSLSLLTKDGAILLEDDPVSLIVGNEEVVSSILSWNIPSLTDRYMEACRSLCSESDTHISSCLETSQATQRLHLSDLALSGKKLTPLFRALNRQHTLQHLLINGNCVDDDGLKMLVSSLSTLSQLQELNLSCNNITGEGIRYFTSIFSNIQERPLQSLTQLDLSHNPLGDGGVKHLCSIVPFLVSLKVLELQNCHITTKCFKSGDIMQNWNSICKLDVSYNALSGDGVLGFLSLLQPTQIISLNFAATEVDDGSSVTKAIVAQFTEKGEFNSLKSLNLSDCKLRDEDIWNLLRVLQKCRELETLQLSGNTELSSVSLCRLLQHEPHLHSVNLAGCINIGDSSNLWIAQHFHNKLESLSISSENCGKGGIAKAWREAWGMRASVHRAPGGLLCLSVKQ